MPSLYLLLLAAVLAAVATNPRVVSRVKRQTPGGVTQDDPTKPEYMKLAEESFAKYKDENPGNTENIYVKEIKVTNATTQVVAGSMKKIDFTVYTCDCESFTCHSEIFEQAWLNKKDINVTCDL